MILSKQNKHFKVDTLTEFLNVFSKAWYQTYSFTIMNPKLSVRCRSRDPVDNVTPLYCDTVFSFIDKGSLITPLRPII